MIRNLILFLLLCGCWFVFSGYTEPFLLTSGLISAALALLLSWRFYKSDSSRFIGYLHLRTLGYIGWLAKEMVVSAWDVSKRVWQPTPSISPILGWVPCSQHSDIGKTIYGNSITLTPGTVCLDVEGNRMLVHALHEDGFGSLMEQEMDRRVATLERAAL